MGNMNDTLAVGSRYLMVEPDHFRVDYAINPFMHLDDQPDPVRTRAAVAGDRGRDRGRRRQRRGRSPQLADAPDMVYAMNLGLALEARTAAGDLAGSCSRTCATPQRRMETPAADAWFADHGFTPSLDRPRRRRRPLRGRRRVRVARRAGRGLRPAHRGAGAQAPRDRARRAACGASGSRTRACTTWTSASARSTRPRDGLPVRVRRRLRRAPCSPSCRSRSCSREEEALTFCANSIVVGRTIVMPACPRPGALGARGVGLRGRASSRSASSSRAAARSGA